MNEYTSAYAPLASTNTYQNLMPQTQMHQNLMQQQAQLAAQAGQTGGSYSGMSPMALASLLRQGKPTQLSDAQKTEISALGSNSWNPLSGYNTGTNGWGNYGE